MERKSNRKLATERQILYANSISSTLGLGLSFSRDDSYYEVNKFITENEGKYKNKGTEKLASIRQIDYANAISNFCNIGISFDENSAYIEVADFISQNKDEYMRMRWRESICEYEKTENSIDVSKESMLFICDNLFKKHGLYAFIGDNDVILYIGKSTDLSSRIPTSYKERKGYAKINKIMYYIDENMANVNIMEILLIAECNPVLNTESKTEDVPTKFHSGIDILNDFNEIPHFCDYEMEVGA